MGERNADRGGRLEGTPVAEMIPETVSPEGLRVRADMMRERGDESCARHLELAADEIIRLKGEAPRSKTKDPLEDPELAAHSYSTATQPEEKRLRLTLYKSPGQKDPLGYMILTCEEIYDVSVHLMRNYDRLEGIE